MPDLPDTFHAFDAITPMIELRDSLNHRVPMANVPITLSVGGGVTHGPTVAYSNASGDAQFALVTIAGRVGQATLRFASPGVDTLVHPVVFTHGPPARIHAIDSTTQTVAVGSAVPILPGVEITDDIENPVPGLEVEFAVWQGGGSVSGERQVTDSLGRARAGAWIVGPEPGLNQLVAQVFMPGGFVTWVAYGVLPSTRRGAPGSQASH